MKYNASNIFDQAFNLTNNLYKVASDIKSITIIFSKYVSGFIRKDDIVARSKIEIEHIIRNIEYINNEYFIPLFKSIEKYDIDNAYKPNASEEALILISDVNFANIHEEVEKLVSNFKDLIVLRDQRINLIKILIITISIKKKKQFLKYCRIRHISNYWDSGPLCHLKIESIEFNGQLKLFI